MRITIHNENGWWEEITIESHTLVAKDSTGSPVSLFGRGEQYDGAPSLREIIEAGMRESEPAPTRNNRFIVKSGNGEAFIVFDREAGRNAAFDRAYRSRVRLTYASERAAEDMASVLSSETVFVEALTGKVAR
jgi:hypothetical protein